MSLDDLSEKIGILQGQIEGLTRYLSDIDRNYRDHAAVEERLLRQQEQTLQAHLREWEGLKGTFVTKEEMTRLSNTIERVKGVRDAIAWVAGTGIGAAVVSAWHYIRGDGP